MSGVTIICLAQGSKGILGYVCVGDLHFLFGLGGGGSIGTASIVPNLWSFSVLLETSRRASESVYGPSLFALKSGLSIFSKKAFRVWGALATWMDEMVHGRVEFWSI